MATTRPRIVLWDLETSHNLVATFSLREEYINHNAIVQERYIICGCWKVLGEKTVHSVSVLDDAKRYKANPHDDRYVVKTIYDPACGTGGMLSVSEQYIRELNSEANPHLFGQDWNDEAWAVCKSDMLIKGEDADNIVLAKLTYYLSR